MSNGLYIFPYTSGTRVANKVQTKQRVRSAQRVENAAHASIISFDLNLAEREVTVNPKRFSESSNIGN